jgi:hypothetical protein
LVALYGFAVAAMWISLFAGEIVALLHFLGVLGGIDPGIMGLTVSQAAGGGSMLKHESFSWHSWPLLPRP